MVMGVVGAPVEDENCDGKVFMKRVSETQTASRHTYFKRIADDCIENSSIQREWKDFYTHKKMTVGGASGLDLSYLGVRVEFFS
jgi:hypothetical protein